MKRSPSVLLPFLAGSIALAGDHAADLAPPVRLAADGQPIERLRELTAAEHAEFAAIMARQKEIVDRFATADPAAIEALEAELAKVDAERARYLAGSESAAGPLGPIHSFIWLHLRIPPSASR